MLFSVIVPIALIIVEDVIGYNYSASITDTLNWQSGDSSQSAHSNYQQFNARVEFSVSCDRLFHFGILVWQ